MSDFTEKAMNAIEETSEKTDEKNFEKAQELDKKLNDASVKDMVKTAAPNSGAMAVIDKLSEGAEKALTKEEIPAPDPVELPVERDTSISDLLTEYKGLVDKINKMDVNNLSEEDRVALNKYADIKDFLDETRNSLDFVKTSTFVQVDENRESMKCYSLLENKELYAELSAKLTNGFDEDFIKEVESTRTQRIDPEYMSKQAYLASVNTPLRIEEIAEVLEPMRHPYTVGEVGDAIDKTKKEMEFNCINKNEVIPSTLALYIAAQSNDCLDLIAQEEINKPEVTPPKYILNYEDEKGDKNTIQTDKWENVVRISTSLMLASKTDVTITDTEANKSVTLEADKYMENYSLADRLQGKFPVTPEDITDVDYENQRKAEKPVEKPVEIVESSDGYVMASSEITPENEAEFSSKVNQANNEVVHNEAPQETTIDPAEVGGKVKLEVAEDLGSKELKQIEHGGGAYGNLASRYENTKYDETPDEPDTYDDDEPEQEEQSFGGFDDII